MDILRAFLSRHRAFAALVVAAALCMKALVPAGYMIGHDSVTLTVELCTDASGATTLWTISGKGLMATDATTLGQLAWIPL